MVMFVKLERRRKQCSRRKPASRQSQNDVCRGGLGCCLVPLKQIKQLAEFYEGLGFALAINEPGYTEVISG